MRLKKTYETGNRLAYKISIGGFISLRWRNHNTQIATMEILSSTDTAYMMGPRLVVNNNALLAIAFAVMKYWLEAAKPRRPHEDLDAYLHGTWEQGLVAMGAKKDEDSRKWTLAGRALSRSKAIKKMKEDRR